MHTTNNETTARTHACSVLIILTNKNRKILGTDKERLCVSEIHKNRTNQDLRQELAAKIRKKQTRNNIFITARVYFIIDTISHSPL